MSHGGTNKLSVDIDRVVCDPSHHSHYSLVLARHSHAGPASPTPAFHSVPPPPLLRKPWVLSNTS
ncbi:hypothetical protein E2C01_046806 [Portunus trituberculatus]|uniref:Uncharacterized protein n=1 Tax=Portunus trituberculatus TaxID=210409 RepID=A0A5B7G616_PORTR|nr:hypothetical protein [Portunus trituberculatus]